MSDDSEIYTEYEKETREILGKMRGSCESLKQRVDKYALMEILQYSHKIKGVAGMMGYSHIEELAGQMESVSKVLVEGKIELKSETIAVLLESMKLLAKYLETDFDERDLALLEKLRLIHVDTPE